MAFQIQKKEVEKLTWGTLVRQPISGSQLTTINKFVYKNASPIWSCYVWFTAVHGLKLASNFLPDFAEFFP